MPSGLTTGPTQLRHSLPPPVTPSQSSVCRSSAYCRHPRPACSRRSNPDPKTPPQAGPGLPSNWYGVIPETTPFRPCTTGSSTSLLQHTSSSTLLLCSPAQDSPVSPRLCRTTTSSKLAGLEEILVLSRCMRRCPTWKQEACDLLGTNSGRHTSTLVSRQGVGGILDADFAA